MVSQAIPPVTLRRMVLADLHQVQRLDTISFSLPWSERSFQFELTENPNSRGWVAELQDCSNPPPIIGMLILWVVLDEAHIATLATLPQYRRLGIARLLLGQALRSAYEEGARRAFLEVRYTNLAAQALYQQFGFAVTGTRRRYYADTGEDALLMTLDQSRFEMLV